jgi:hypothetical protein
MKRYFFLDSYYTKLLLYVVTASLTALLSDLQHHLCKSSGEVHLTWTQLTIVVINFVLQGLIAWRAFIDDSAEKRSKEVDVPQTSDDNRTHETRSIGTKK